MKFVIGILIGFGLAGGLQRTTVAGKSAICSSGSNILTTKKWDCTLGEAAAQKKALAK